MRPLGYYILDENHRPVPVDDVLVWGRWFEDINNRRVAETHTKLFIISTVCLGIDHQFYKGPPILFETMSFERQPHIRRWLDGTLSEVHADDECVRYSTWDDAMEGHNTMVRRYLKREQQAAEAILHMEQLTEDMQKVANALNEKIQETTENHHDE